MEEVKSQVGADLTQRRQTLAKVKLYGVEESGVAMWLVVLSFEADHHSSSEFLYRYSLQLSECPAQLQKSMPEMQSSKTCQIS